VNPTLYDILGVPRDAGPDEIKRAWRDAADRFEPGSGSSGAQFRLFNEAAEVLLDPDRRRAYDAELVDHRPGDVPDQPPAPAEQITGPSGWIIPVGHAVPARERAAAAGAGTPVRSGGPWLAVLAALAAVLVVAAIVLGVIDLRRLAEAEDAEDATQQAPAAAERAAAAILSYDFTSLGADEEAAARYLTDAYKKQYTATFDKLVEPSATELHAHVEAEVKASSVVHADPHRASVLLFVNQTTTSTAHGGEPQVALNRVQMAMVERDGTWLVDNITSY
jgi:Mce-associated membrane protein